MTTHHAVDEIATQLHDDLEREAPELVAAVDAFARGLEAAGFAVRSEGINDPALLRAVADTADESTPFDRGWTRGLRIYAAAIEDGDAWPADSDLSSR